VKLSGLGRTSAALAITAAAALATWSVTQAQEKDSASSGLAEMANKVQEVQLANGLRILVLERHDAPVVAFATAVNVGSVDENTGETGLAHMFEHMAFKGSTTIGTSDWEKEKVALDDVEKSFLALKRAKLEKKPKDQLEKLRKEFEQAQEAADKFVNRDEFSTIITRNGGAGLNAFTSADQTVYHVELPANRLELWFHLESDRFRDPVLREFYKEKGAVEEERRMRTESNPIGGLFEEFLAGAFRAHPYGRPVIGHMSDLDVLSATAAKKFFARFYTPNNMVIAIVGDVTKARVQELAEKYFGPMPRGPELEPVPTIETPQKGERRVDVVADAQPVVILGWHGPSVREEDTVALDALTDVLSAGRTSRFYRSLVVQKKVAVQAQIGIGDPGQKYPNLTVAFAVPAPGKTTDDCVEAIEEELERVKTELVSEEELAIVKTRARANFIRGLRGNMGLAQGLAIRQTIHGDWRELFTYPDKVAKLTPKHLQDVAKKYLVRAHRTRGEIVKPYAAPKKADAKKPAEEKKPAEDKKKPADDKDEGF
jgi:predicted Zn-dependent peptidase